MPTRPDLRDVTVNVRQAFADCDRDTLLDVLTFIVREYVAEGPPPMLTLAEGLEELAGLSFADLVLQLQARLPHAEWGNFVVDNGRVGVRSAGVVHPVGAARAPDLSPPAETPAPAPAAAPPLPSPAAVAPRASAGLSVRGRNEAPTASNTPIAPAPPAAPSPPAASIGAAAGSAAPPPAEEPKPSGDDASARFQLLELD